MEHKILYYQNKKIHYQDEGNGNHVLVLLHGFMNSLEVWSSFVYSYMRETRVIAIDLPGHGKSDSLQDVHSMELMADVVKAVLDDAHVEKCVMIGHSMGGYVTAAFSEKYPLMINGFGFLHSHVLKDDEEAKKNRYRACEVVRNNRTGYIINFIPNLFSEKAKNYLQREIENLQDVALEMKSESVVAAQMGMAERESKVDLLLKTDEPVLFIYGKKDSRIPLELAMSQAMLPKHSEILLLDNVAHMGHLEAREIVKFRIKSFVEGCYKIKPVINNIPFEIRRGDNPL